MSSLIPSRLRRTLAAVAAVGVGAAGLTLLPGSPAAHAAPAPLALQWEISQQFDNHLCAHTLTGVTESEDGVVTFPDGVGSYDPATGVTEIAYTGSVRGGFVPGMMGQCDPAGTTPVYTVTFADPVLAVDESGEGEISALVSATVPSQSIDLPPSRVVVTTFDAAAGDWTAAEGVGTLTDTPDWAGVLPDGPGSAALGIPAGQPVDGKAWAPELLGHLPQGLRAHFYYSSGSDLKAPSAFTATAPEAAEEVVPEVAIETTSATRSGVQLSVDGTGFTAENLPGVNGAYVGLAPAGGVPDDLDMAEGIAYFAAVNWVMPHQITDGAFTTVLSAQRAKLDPRKRYAVYVWPGHTSWSEDTSTETPTSIGWKALGFPLAPKATLKVIKRPAPQHKGKAAVAVTGAHVTPYGKVTITWAKGKARKSWTRTLQKGRATVALPRSAKGRWTLRAVTTANPVYRVARTSKRVRVTR